MSKEGSKERKAEGTEKGEKEKKRRKQNKTMSWGRSRHRQPEKSRRSDCLKKTGEAPATRKVGGGPPQGRAYFASCRRRRRSRRGGAIFSRALILGQFYGSIGSV